MSPPPLPGQELVQGEGSQRLVEGKKVLTRVYVGTCLTAPPAVPDLVFGLNPTARGEASTPALPHLTFLLFMDRALSVLSGTLPSM